MTSIEKPIFINNNGPMAFFLETVSVQDRRTVRALIKKHGGEVVHEPLKADILIAEGDSAAVTDFINAWGREKVILETSWIYHCLETGKTIDRGRSWGGFRKSNRASDDNDELEEEEEEEEEDYRERRQQILPSPPPISHINEKRPADNSGGSYDPHQAYSRTMLGSNLDVPPPKKRKLKENAETSRVHIAPTPPPRSQASSSSTQTYQTSPPLSTPAFSQSTQDVFAALGQQVLSSPHFIPLLGPALQKIFTQQSNTDPDLVAAQLRDIAQVISVSGSSQQASQMPRATTSPMHSLPRSLTPPIRSPPTPRTSNLSSIKSEDEVEPRLSIPSQRQKGNSDDGIQRAYRTLPPSKKHPVKGDSTPPPPVVIQKTGFFSNLDGFPSKFFLDLNIKNRRDLINNVKKNGGSIVSSMPESDYVVLNKYSAQFSKMIGSVPLDITTVSHEWLEECVRRNEFVPPESYYIEITPTPKGRRNQTTSSPRKKLVRKQVGNESR